MKVHNSMKQRHRPTGEWHAADWAGSTVYGCPLSFCLDKKPLAFMKKYLVFVNLKFEYLFVTFLKCDLQISIRRKIICILHTSEKMTNLNRTVFLLENQEHGGIIRFHSWIWFWKALSTWSHWNLKWACWGKREGPPVISLKSQLKAGSIFSLFT